VELAERCHVVDVELGDVGHGDQPTATPACPAKA
jgi:hypothetical protein